MKDKDRLVIGDFGLSKQKDEIRSKTKGDGTSAYMSPECFRHGTVTTLSDIWYLKEIFIQI